MATATPHEFLIPEQVLRTALGLIRDDLFIAATFNRDYESDFGGGKGASVNVRIPAVLKARRRTLAEAGTPIVVDKLKESTVAVKMTHMIYSAVDLTDEQMTFSIEDFTRQVTAPQLVAMVEDIENFCVETMQALPESVGIAYDPAAPELTFTRARKTLRDLGLPADGLWAACGTGVYANLVDAKAISDASQSGSTEALRNAGVGKVRGFNTVESNRLDDDEIVFYGRDAFTLAIRAPKVPAGAAKGESRSENGFAMRWVQDYDSNILADRSIFSTFIGAQALKYPRLDKNDPDGFTEIVPALRVKTGTPVA
ncbi:P22 phage major capsid protein family protein [Micromonospora sp. WMMD980]|uniref:P22 phage major capsid protein family protein n=1 Tax=Micromonospora sp. WMMD980 TaxID=3016088 RepID=UPI0024169F73|nr:P22 phage major capsid protein family protein [Micromonospora sp. WMMD980]MDG4801715.1 P22 phage major capsid protein family protein [Micromonospora sp. WMMD980]